MIAELIQLHPQKKWDHLIKVIIASLLLFLIDLILVDILQQQALPYAWAGIVLIGMWLGMPLGWIALFISQCLFTAYQLLFFSEEITPYLLFGIIGIGAKISEWMAVIVVGKLCQWEESAKPWWNYLIAVLGLSILYVGIGFWAKAPYFEEGWKWLKQEFTDIFILAAFLLMITQITKRLLTGRAQFYSKH
jgi:hypothetical protein